MKNLNDYFMERTKCYIKIILINSKLVNYNYFLLAFKYEIEVWENNNRKSNYTFQELDMTYNKWRKKIELHEYVIEQIKDKIEFLDSQINYIRKIKLKVYDTRKII